MRMRCFRYIGLVLKASDPLHMVQSTDAAPCLWGSGLGNLPPTLCSPCARHSMREPDFMG